MKRDVQVKKLDNPYTNLLVRGDGFLQVLVSHADLDNLIARLMHIAELDSDKEHREALKGELKYQCRQWLDGEYDSAGYRNYALQPGARILELKDSTIITADKEIVG